MTVSETASSISVPDYLKGERDGQVRHEYVAGRVYAMTSGSVYAMTGGSVYHNRISLAFASVLREKLGGHPCDVFMADMKVQTRQAFYYPDIMVVCDPADRDPYSKSRPLTIAEVVSPNTRSIDEREKRAAYLELETLREYVLAEQDRPELRVIHRDAEDGWSEEVYSPDDVIRLQALGLNIAMQHLYEGAY